MADLSHRGAVLVIAVPNSPAQDRATRCATPAIALRHVTVCAPDGRVLLNDLTADFMPERVGLVGRNGAGKSLLAQTLIGLVIPDTGHVVRTGTVAYAPQTIRPAARSTVAGLAGLGAAFAALDRMERGAMTAADYDLLDGRWDLRAAFARILTAAGLPHIEPDALAASLSGGECTRVALCGALLSDADVLILDEPTNHLDRDARMWLRAQLQHWQRGVIVVSHDRELLDDMDRIVAVTSAGLCSYGGNYSAYRTQRDAQDQAAQNTLDHALHERRVADRVRRRQHDAQLRHNRHNASAARHANLPGILLGRRKDNAQAHAGREHVRQLDARLALDNAVRRAAADAAPAADIALLLPDTALPAGRRVAEFVHVVPPFSRATAALSLTIAGPMRIGVTGPNGCGKTTLLRLLAQQIAPQSGQCHTRVSVATLDQHAHALLAPERCVLATLAELACPLPEGVVRSHLALLGLRAEHVTLPSRDLSGGERLKAALACALWRKHPAQLLLLDEPTNHLDLESIAAFEAALTHYAGALVVVSHDVRFLAALNLTHDLQWRSNAWRLHQR